MRRFRGEGPGHTKLSRSPSCAHGGREKRKGTSKSPLGFNDPDRVRRATCHPPHCWPRRSQLGTSITFRTPSESGKPVTAGNPAPGTHLGPAAATILGPISSSVGTNLAADPRTPPSRPRTAESARRPCRRRVRWWTAEQDQPRRKAEPPGGLSSTISAAPRTSLGPPPRLSSWGPPPSATVSRLGDCRATIARSISPSSAREGVLVDAIRAGEPAKCHQIGGCTRRNFQARLHVTLPSALSGSPHAQRPADVTPSMVQHRCSTNYTRGASNRRKQNRAKRPDV